MRKKVGRKKETEILKELLKTGQPEFLAVYGRRRVGKTYLVREVYQDSFIFDCTGLNGTGTKEQLQNFWLNLSKYNKQPILPPGTWLIAFNQLENYIDSISGKAKKVIFLDEIPWMDTLKSGFIAALSNFWNHYCTKRDDILLVICGSAASWVIDKIVKNTGGLHNRLTRTIKLESFTLSEVKDYLKSSRVNLTQKDIAQLYMCTGGIPYYLDGVKPGRSIPQVLDDLFFAKEAFLKGEFENLYAALFKNHEAHIEVVRALATKNKGLTRNEIINNTSAKSGGTLTKVLNELHESGFIIIIDSIENKKENKLFRLMDEYSLFYHKFLHNKKTFRSGIQLGNSQAFKIWAGFAFENLVIRHQYQVAKSLGISGIVYDVYSFVKKGNKSGPGSQIDLVFDRSDQSINIIEAKFSNAVYKMTGKYAENVRNKLDTFLEKTKSKKNIFFTMITPFGAEKNEHYLSVVTNELLLDDLFQ